VQYNVLIGQLNDDLAARGGPANVITDPHTLAPNQCVDCHVPAKYSIGGTNVAGHKFVSDNNGCLVQCHSALGSTAALATKTLNSKITCSNSIDRVVSLLKQWGMTVAPDILRTNYGTCAWEYPSPLAYFGAKTTNFVVTSTNTASNTTNYVVGSTFITGWGITNMVIGVKSTYVSNSITYASVATNMILGWTNGIALNFLTGPPTKWNGLGGQPSGTNDNLQLAYVPQNIRIARFSLYWIYEDQSYGVHNPTYVKSLLADAENRVANQFVAASYPAYFTGDTLIATNSVTVNFSAPYTGGATCNWDFGDPASGGSNTATGATASHAYTNGLYSVTCTVSTVSTTNVLTRTKYITVW
jgi:hypothetical protein